MKKRIEKSFKGQTAITFISGSAGELDWVLPILDFLLNKGFNVKFIFLRKLNVLVTFHIDFLLN